MKNYIIWILMALYAITAHGQQTLLYCNGQIRDSIESTLPTCSIIDIDDGILVTYHFSKAQLIDDQIYKGSTMWKIDGFGINDTESQPAVLRRSDAFLIPEGKKGKVVLLDCKYTDYSSKLSPAYPPLIDSSSEPYSIANIPDIADYEGWFPQEIARSEAEFNYRGYRLNYVQLSPIQYNIRKQTVRAYSEISYKIVFNQDPEYVNQSTQKTTASQGSQWQDSKLLSNIVRNYPVAQVSDNSALTKITPVDPGKIDIAEDYLIITTPKYTEAAEKFAEWKRHLGYKPVILKSNNWTPETVKAAVKLVYESSDSMRNILIIGGHWDVPSEAIEILEESGILNEDGNIASDYKYGYIPDGDIFPYLYRGRLLANTQEEAENMVSKIIKYEKDPIVTPDYYKNAMSCAYFEDGDYKADPSGIAYYSGDTYEDRRFTLTSEEIRDYLINQGKSVERIYYAKSAADPKHWNPDKYFDGSDIPDELTKPKFKWNGSNQDITASINDGKFLVMYRSHAETDRWGYPTYRLSDISSLTNDEHQPVVFSITCKSGRFDKSNDCFAQRFLTTQGGCVGIIAATRTSYSGYDDALIEGMIDGIWPYPGLYPYIPSTTVITRQGHTPVYSLGEILEVGMARMFESYGITNLTAEAIYRLFHCFGDPSMKIYTEQPVAFKNVTVYKGPTMFVNVSEAPYDTKIIFYDKKSGDIKAYNSSSATYNTTNPDYITVTICAHNRIPFIDLGLNANDIIIQNEVITASKNYDGDNILIGSCVSKIMAPGDVEIKANNVTVSGSRIEIYPKTTITGSGFKAVIKK